MRKARIYDTRQLPAYLSTAQYAELMSIDQKTVQKMCRSGLLPAEKVEPRLWRIDKNRALEQGKLNRPNKKARRCSEHRRAQRAMDFTGHITPKNNTIRRICKWILSSAGGFRATAFTLTAKSASGSGTMRGASGRKATS